MGTDFEGWSTSTSSFSSPGFPQRVGQDTVGSLQIRLLAWLQWSPWEIGTSLSVLSRCVTGVEEPLCFDQDRDADSVLHQKRVA